MAGLAARGPALVRLRRGRISDDLFVAPILQQIALDVLTAPGWTRQLSSLRRVLRERRDALVAAIAAQLPGCELARVPAGGVHLWLRLPDGCSENAVVAQAAALGVAVGPGRVCFPAEPPAAYLRLSYAGADAATLVSAADTLAVAISSANPAT